MKKPIRKRPMKIRSEYAHIRKRKIGSKTHKNPARSPWASRDGEYMNEVAASSYLGLSVSRLQNMRCERVGPMFHKPDGRVYYIKRELKDYMESGSSRSA